MTVVIYEDDACEALAPISTGRLVATITCGALRLLDIAIELSQDVYGVSRGYLEPIQAHDYPSLKVINELTSESPNIPRLLLSARIAPTQSNRMALEKLLSKTTIETEIVRDRDAIVAVLNPNLSVVDLANAGQRG